MSEQNCECCGDRLAFRWSDTHGVGVCYQCGLPYTVYHYEGDTRVEKPPTVAVTPEGVEIAKRYWSEEHRRVFPAAYDMGILGSRGWSYSGATEDDCRKFADWYAAHVPLPSPVSAPGEGT